jgi:hypothetical protein
MRKAPATVGVAVSRFTERDRGATMLRTILIAVVSFTACFASGNLIQLVLRYPRDQIRRNLIPGIVTSLAVAIYVVIVRSTGWLSK